MTDLDKLVQKAISGDLNAVREVLTSFTPEQINEKYSYNAFSRAYLDEDTKNLDSEIKQWRKWNIVFKEKYSNVKIPEKYKN